MCYPVCGMMHIKKTLLLIRKSNPCGGSWFPLAIMCKYVVFVIIILTRTYHVQSNDAQTGWFSSLANMVSIKLDVNEKNYYELTMPLYSIILFKKLT